MTSYRDRIDAEYGHGGLVIAEDDLYGRHSLRLVREYESGERASVVYSPPTRSYFIRCNENGREGLW
ncbi:hypothetical protein SEA_NANOSMITE_133 [Mycobacterium phage Nanosmite]|nr:hypothetical protein SEA_NANOSMITE_133 [Mycobacterium phage Nanosmite]